MPQSLSQSLLVAFVALSGASYAQSPIARYAFGPGEQASYKVEYLGLRAGSAQITVGAEMTQYGKSVWPIVTLAKTDSVAAVYPIRDKFVTYWEYGSQKTVGNDLFADENRKRRRQRIKLEHATLKAEVMKQKEGHPEKVSTHDISPNALDIAAAMFALRNKPLLRVGEVHVFPVFTGDRMFDLHATVEAKQQLKTGIGLNDVFKVRVRTEFGGNLESKRDMYLYLTADDRRIPVRVEADFALGKLAAEITDYKQGREIVLRATEDNSAQAGTR
jgi:hypothetical protein